MGLRVLGAGFTLMRRARWLSLILCSTVLSHRGLAEARPEIVPVASVPADTVVDALLDSLGRAPTPQACNGVVWALYSQEINTIARTLVYAHLGEHAATCGQRFDPKTLDDSQLQAAGDLYALGGLTAQLHMALDRQIASATTDSARIRRLIFAIKSCLNGDGSPTSHVSAERLALAEQYVATLARIPTVPSSQRLFVLTTLRYTLPSTDPRRDLYLQQARRIVEALSPADRRTTGGRKTVCDLAEMEAEDAGHAEQFSQAVALLHPCLELLASDTSRALRYERENLQRIRLRNTLVGAPAPTPIQASYWINAPKQNTTVDLTRPVTILEFTEPGCPGCRLGYPTLRRLDAQYRARGLQLLLVTFLGYNTDFPDPDAEVADAKRVWVQGDSIAFPIAFLDKNPHGDNPTIFAPWGVNGFPTYYVFDRHGRIRYMQTGHSDDFETHLTAIIERLLKES